MNQGLKGAKVGDMVIVSFHYHGESIDKISAITKAGNYKIGSSVFTPQGRERATGWYVKYARVATTEEIKQLRDKWEYENLKKKIEAVVSDLDMFKLKQIANILEQELI